MPKAIWKDVVLAEHGNCEVVDGATYFPKDAVKMELLTPTQSSSVCGWKGQASYYTVVVDGEENVDAAWCYAKTKEAAKGIEGQIAFWKGVEII